MKLISWNVNGLRACLPHGFAESFAALDADIFSVGFDFRFWVGSARL